MSVLTSCRFCIFFRALQNLTSSANFIRSQITHLIETLVGSDAAFRKIVRYFALHGRIGMMGPAGFYMSSHFLSEGDGCDMYTLLARYAPDDIDDEWGFFAVTMFCARTEILSPMYDLSLDMEAASRYEDREIANAIEPIFGLLPIMQNWKIGVIDSTSNGIKIRQLDGIGKPIRSPIVPFLINIRKKRRARLLTTVVRDHASVH